MLVNNGLSPYITQTPYFKRLRTAFLHPGIVAGYLYILCKEIISCKPLYIYPRIAIKHIYKNIA